MNKMVFAFDEARARRDGVDPAALWAMVDGWVDQCVNAHHGQYIKEIDPEGGVAYIGFGHETDWDPVFMGVIICSAFSEPMARYGKKWLWFYDDGEDIGEDNGYCKDILTQHFEKNEFYQRYHQK